MSSQVKIFVAMSGGVDSSVTAALLKKRGFDVIGIYIKGWSLTGCAGEDSADARRVAGQLNIPFYVFNFEDEYKKHVVDYMVSEYKSGKTPNPDVMCNREIKFGLFLKKALALGADYIATGHYVRLCEREKMVLSETSGAGELGDFDIIARSASKSRRREDKRRLPLEQPKRVEEKIFSLFAAIDKNKDQSYFLWTLTQDQLKYCLFPIGDYTKPQIRALAKKLGLATAQKPDSQGVCFIGEIDVAGFLKEKLGKKPGPVKTCYNKLVGEHDGLSFYTIGQRKGIGAIGGGTPYYVVSKDYATNILLVAEAQDRALFKNILAAKGASWISEKPKFPLRCRARIRYRQPLENCTVDIEAGKLRVSFDKPQRAITPGQSVVFYKNKKMLGGAVIFN